MRGVGYLCHPGEGRVNHKPEDLVTAREMIDTIIGRMGEGGAWGDILKGVGGEGVRCDEM